MVLGLSCRRGGVRQGIESEAGWIRDRFRLEDGSMDTWLRFAIPIGVVVRLPLKSQRIMPNNEAIRKGFSSRIIA